MAKTSLTGIISYSRIFRRFSVSIKVRGLINCIFKQNPYKAFPIFSMFYCSSNEQRKLSNNYERIVYVKCCRLSTCWTDCIQQQWGK